MLTTWSINDCYEENYDKCIWLNTFFGGILIILGIWYLVAHNFPQAIDVYRGKTTLQITYKNNIPIDTTVVYK